MAQKRQTMEGPKEQGLTQHNFLLTFRKQAPSHVNEYLHYTMTFFFPNVTQRELDEQFFSQWVV